MTKFITVMGTPDKPPHVDSSSTPLFLEAYRVNAAAIVTARDLDSREVCMESGGTVSFYSPICELQLTGMTLYVSGVADELLARLR